MAISGGIEGAIRVTLLEAGESLVWTPPASGSGSGVNAFTIIAWDKIEGSSTPVQVKVDVAPGE